jgi:L-ascorbate metabolism protein UlaG (beta-lactamase superfamily)
MQSTFSFPEGLQILYLGHSSFKITTGSGKVILIDPWLKQNPVCPEEHKHQEQADLILISHGHDDHLDKDLPQLAKKTGAVVIAPSEVLHFLEQRGVSKTESMNKGGSQTVHGQRVTMTHAFHHACVWQEDGTVGYFHESAGYVLETEEKFRIYFAGDTGLFGDMQLIGKLYQPNIAILPIGDRYTMGPVEAAYAVQLLGTSYVIPMHFGTFPILTGTPEAFREATTGILDLTIRVMQPGEVLNTASA